MRLPALTAILAFIFADSLVPVAAAPQALGTPEAPTSTGEGIDAERPRGGRVGTAINNGVRDVVLPLAATFGIPAGIAYHLYRVSTNDLVQRHLIALTQRQRTRQKHLQARAWAGHEQLMRQQGLKRVFRTTSHPMAPQLLGDKDLLHCMMVKLQIDTYVRQDPAPTFL
jgi:hypothetical protein